jgi:sulfonate transport system permease protein
MTTVAARLRSLPLRLAPALSVLAALLTWELVHRSRLVNPLFLPSPEAVADVGRRLAASGALATAWAASLERLLAGYAAGALIAVVGGVILGVSRPAERALQPTLAALKQISPFAVIPLLSFWFGLREPAKIAFIALTCVFPVLVNTFEGVRSVSPRLLEVGRVYGLGRWATIRRIVLPAAAPSILSGLHLGVFFSWLGTVGAEYFLSAGPGLGNFIIDGRSGFRMELVFFGIAAIGATGIALDGTLDLAERRLLRWRPEQG